MGLTGTTVRSIRLVEKLGEGGMGEVYLGLDERLGRRVAVKAVRAERRLDAETRARFSREARVLSQLDHPHICRLYDYVEGEGSDFIVLELVRGRTLRRLLAEPPPFERRLEIASQTADALVAAHALGVVHRDLKPENIMISDEGQVKVLDFGLARPVAPAGETNPAPAGAAPRLADHRDSASGSVTAATDTTDRPPGATPSETGGEAAVTRLGMVVGTLRYMSPEQARGEGLTAASDIYSLGLILQELFTGREAVRDAGDLEGQAQLARWGETRKVEGIDSDLASLLEGMKALEPRDRPSAESTRERLRWIAGKPGRRRRRLLRAAVLAALVVATVVSSVGALLAWRARRSAEAAGRQARAAQAEAEAVNAFLLRMLASADPTRVGIEVKVVDVLDRAAASAEADLSAQVTARAAVLETLGRTYHSLGVLPKARELLARAVALRLETEGPRAAGTLSASHNLGALLGTLGRFGEAEARLRETLDLRRQVLGAEHRDTLITLGALAWTLHAQRRLQEAEPLYRECHQTALRVLGPRDESTITAMRNLGMVLRDQDRLDQADPLIQGAYERSLASFGPGHLLTLDCLHTLALLRAQQRRPVEAVAILRRLIDAMTAARGAEHPTTIKLGASLARSLAESGRPAEGERVARAALAVQRRVIGPAHRDTLETMRTLVHCYARQGRDREAGALARERWRVARLHLGDLDPLTLETKSLWAWQLAAAGKLAEAERLYREVLAARLRVLGPDASPTRQARANLAWTLRKRGRSAEAESIEAAGQTAPRSASASSSRSR